MYRHPPPTGESDESAVRCCAAGCCMWLHWGGGRSYGPSLPSKYSWAGQSDNEDQRRTRSHPNLFTGARLKSWQMGRSVYCTEKAFRPTTNVWRHREWHTFGLANRKWWNKRVRLGAWPSNFMQGMGLWWNVCCEAERCCRTKVEISRGAAKQDW